MSPAPADLVSAVELAGRAARLDRRLGLAQLPRLVEAGALEGSEFTAQLQFDTFEGRVTVEVRVLGQCVLTCQRCLQPCACAVDETAMLAVVERETDLVPGGYEPLPGDAERLSLAALIEEQVLLGLPLVPRHDDAALCGTATAATGAAPAEPVADEKQRPFAKLRQLLDEGTG